AGEAVEHWPSTRGGKNWPHAAYNPQTGLLYANTLHEGRMYKHLKIEPYVKGQRYQFIENLPVPRVPGEPIGHVDAIDPVTGQQQCRHPLTDLLNSSAPPPSAGRPPFSAPGTRASSGPGAPARSARCAVPTPAPLK